jgi:hypothetical protein
MADYLADYGVKDQKREKRNKLIVFTVIGSVIVAGLVWYFARTFSEERTAKRFVALLESKDYKGAYAMWGCTDQTPCRDYKFERFLEDWGPKSPYSNPGDISFTLAETCGNSVWVTLKTPKTEELGISVDPDTKFISFTPAARCPGQWRFREFPARLWRYMHSQP